MRLVLLLLLCFSDLSSPDLPAYRRLLDASFADEKAANQFYEQFASVKESDAAVMVGFRAMSEFMICKHLINPFSRLNHFNRGKKLLESAIRKDHHSPELLFFRLTTQSNVPSLLKYNKNIQTDIQNLILYLKADPEKAHTDKDLHRRIRSYLLVNDYCSAADKTLIRSL